MINKYVSQDSSLPREWRIRSYSIPMPPDVSISMSWWVSIRCVCSSGRFQQAYYARKYKKQCYHVISTIPLANHSLTKKWFRICWSVCRCVQRSFAQSAMFLNDIFMLVPHRWRDLSSFEKTSEIWLNWPWAAGQPRCPVLNTGRAARNLQRSSGGTVSNLILLQQSFYISKSHNMPELRIVVGLSQPPDMVTDGRSSSSSSSSTSSSRSRSRSRSSSTTTPTPTTATATATVIGFTTWMNGHAMPVSWMCQGWMSTTWWVPCF